MTARRVVLKSLLFALTGAVGLAAVTLLFHDQIFRVVVLQLASRVPGLEAIVDGQLDLTPGFPDTVDITGVNLEFGGKAFSGSQWRDARAVSRPSHRGSAGESMSYDDPF